MKKYPDACININHPDDENFESDQQIIEAFKCQTREDILRPHMFDRAFRSSNDGNDVGYNFFVFCKG